MISKLSEIFPKLSRKTPRKNYDSRDHEIKIYILSNSNAETTFDSHRGATEHGGQMGSSPSQTTRRVLLVKYAREAYIARGSTRGRSR